MLKNPWILFHQKWPKKFLLPFVHNLFIIIFFDQKPAKPHQERIYGILAMDKNLLFTPIYFNLGKINKNKKNYIVKSIHKICLWFCSQFVHKFAKNLRPYIGRTQNLSSL